MPFIAISLKRRDCWHLELMATSSSAAIAVFEASIKFTASESASATGATTSSQVASTRWPCMG